MTRRNGQIPHDYDIRHPGELYAAMVCFPVTACFWEADCLFRSPLEWERPPLDMFTWQAHWWDVCSYNLGYALTCLLADISRPNLWDTEQAQMGFTHALETAKTASINAFICHDGNYLQALGCFMARTSEAARKIEAQHGYPHGLISKAVRAASHRTEMEKHLSCL